MKFSSLDDEKKKLNPDSASGADDRNPGRQSQTPFQTPYVWQPAPGATIHEYEPPRLILRDKRGDECFVADASGKVLFSLGKFPTLPKHPIADGNPPAR